MSAISDNLIHFLARQYKDSPNKQLDIFKLIINNGLRTSEVQIKFLNGANVLNQSICFTDIPLRECNGHTSIYGKFGIGFKKSYIKNAGGNPARYFLDYLPSGTVTETEVESRGSLYFNLCNQHDVLMKLYSLSKANSNFALFDNEGNTILSANELEDYIKSAIFAHSFDKEMGDLGPARDETEEIDLFYKEREWRLVPSRLSEISGSVNQIESGHFIYPFNRDDVNMIVVPNEELRLSVLEYFLELKESTDERLKQFGENPLPIINYDDLHRW